MHCDDDIYGIKNITTVYPSGKVTVVNYHIALVTQSGFSHENSLEKIA